MLESELKPKSGSKQLDYILLRNQMICSIVFNFNFSLNLNLNLNVFFKILFHLIICYLIN